MLLFSLLRKDKKTANCCRENCPQENDSIAHVISRSNNRLPVILNAVIELNHQSIDIYLLYCDCTYLGNECLILMSRGLPRLFLSPPVSFPSPFQSFNTYPWIFTCLTANPNAHIYHSKVGWLPFKNYLDTTLYEPSKSTTLNITTNGTSHFRGLCHKVLSHSAGR